MPLNSFPGLMHQSILLIADSSRSFTDVISQGTETPTGEMDTCLNRQRSVQPKLAIAG